MSKQKRGPGFSLVVMMTLLAVAAAISFVLELAVLLTSSPMLSGRALYWCVALGVFSMLLSFVSSCYLFRIRRSYVNLKKLAASLESSMLADVEPETVTDSFFSDVISLLLKLYYAQKKEYTGRILYKQAELDALQSQINPHFLYNTLECIRGLAVIEGIQQIAQMTESLSSLFRYSISTKGNLVTLLSELNNTRSYFFIQQCRFNNKFSLRVEYEDGDESVNDCMVPKLTLQPILENAIFHGLETKFSKGSVVIRISSTPKRLLLCISDNGIGMSNATLQSVQRKLLNESVDVAGSEEAPRLEPGESAGRHSGIALTNVHKRILLHFGPGYGLTVNSAEGIGTDVFVTLPRVIYQEQSTEELEVS